MDDHDERRRVCFFNDKGIRKTRYRDQRERERERTIGAEELVLVGVPHRRVILPRVRFLLMKRLTKLTLFKGHKQNRWSRKTHKRGTVSFFHTVYPVVVLVLRCWCWPLRPGQVEHRVPGSCTRESTSLHHRCSGTPPQSARSCTCGGRC